MPDREKVKKGLNICNSINHPCNECPYVGERNCSLAMVTDALALLQEHDNELIGIKAENSRIFSENIRLNKLLKEQEAVEPVLIREGRNKNYNDYVCPGCDNELHYGQNYCSECGRAVKWNGQGEGYQRVTSALHKP